ncbi:hypothetical protein XENOCAPTIV_003898 [Xenoophorus captivus]|uniref:Spartan-like zinc binding domain-containing protein n=1 Tax=Xenoophorus captivus TaxID=1517983 RepID=A0ABV0QGB1_9TELE
MDADFLLASQLQEQFDNEYQRSQFPPECFLDDESGQSRKKPKAEASGGGSDATPRWKPPTFLPERPLSIVDESWEMLDPNPDVRAMFLEFNDMFFWGKLSGVEIYHSFHDEVDVYRQHWWRCNGPCQSRKPYFGYVKRSMNRAPSSQDPWWEDHQRTCGGTYTKVKEPEGYGKKNKKETKASEKNIVGNGKPSKTGKGDGILPYKHCTNIAVVINTCCLSAQVLDLRT